MNRASAILHHRRQEAEWITLDNGLVVMVQPEHAARQVAVRLSYQIGSRHEPKLKRGLAHLFEHLMFAGTARFPGNAFSHLEEMGATSINAISREDYTSYFELLSPEWLANVLAFEGDRAQFLPAAFDAEELERSRQIVRSELIERGSQPYGIIDELLAVEGYTSEHPYSAPPNGVAGQLENINLKDTADWLSRHSNPAHANLVIAGRVEPEEVFAQAQRYFGCLPRKSALVSAAAPPASILQNRRRRATHNCAENRTYLVWNLPGFELLDRTELRMLLELLIAEPKCNNNPLGASKKGSAAIGGELRIRELASQLVLWCAGSPLACFEQAEEQMRKRLTSIIQRGVSERELRAAGQRLIQQSDNLNLAATLSEQAQALALSWIFKKDPNACLDDLADLIRVTSDQLQNIAVSLREPSLVLEIEGHSARPIRRIFELQAHETLVHVSSSPISKRKPGDKLSEALSVIVASCPDAQPFEFRVIVESGFAEEHPLYQGITGVAATIISENLNRGSYQHNHCRSLTYIGSQVYPDVVSFRAGVTSASTGLQLLLEMLAAPPVDETALHRAKQAQMLTLTTERTHPFKIALRVLPELLCGSSNGYGGSWTGSGTEEGIERIRPKEVCELLRQWTSVRPVKIVAVGPRSEQELTALAAETLSRFSARKCVLSATAPAAPLFSARSHVVISSVIENKGQVAMYAGLAARRQNPEQLDALMLATAVLGGPFSSRLNLRLREDRQYTYGARAQLLASKQMYLWLAYANIRSDIVVDAMREVENVVWSLANEQPPTQAELYCARSFVLAQLQSNPRDVTDTAAKLESSLICEAPACFFKAVKRINRVSAEAVSQACRTLLAESKLQWLLLGHARTLSRAIVRQDNRDLHFI